MTRRQRGRSYFHSRTGQHTNTAMFVCKHSGEASHYSHCYELKSAEYGWALSSLGSVRERIPAPFTTMSVLLLGPGSIPKTLG